MDDVKARFPALHRDESTALREITQEIILAGLGRTDLFGRAGLQGGTCLRIFHSLTRFSEDMDFALDAPDPTGAFADTVDLLLENVAGGEHQRRPHFALVRRVRVGAEVVDSGPSSRGASPAPPGCPGCPC
ncbi:MAG: nucleotidyl transferase AbiEii/AbiGii toxin family protein [bacterium]|nr:nucleotidyl transferase AbiEii/AbiGii toxin family protein [bacterium]